MNNPFAGIKIHPETDTPESGIEDQKKQEMRDAIYRTYDLMVNQVLDLFLDSHRQVAWEKGTDCERRYCCHVAWFAGPKEKFTDPYDLNHTIRRRLEIRLEVDGMCNPTGFSVTNYAAISKTVRVGLEKEDLIRGVKEVMA